MSLPEGTNAIVPKIAILMMSLCCCKLNELRLHHKSVCQMRYVQNWGEVAPSLILLTHQKSSMRCPKLETILEEASEDCLKFTGQSLNGLLLAFPVVLSLASHYFLQYR
ncbi:hypothetical protein SAY87_021971 [Trapa incisa]|uniref:Uncharacterized protein n=1 Tax=Trapa incisa TaxID=236973 RepID=A0AAN7JXV5_9MYRT|nr:hypothetical protein SAY87_021971 [Trapa incisa]